MHDPTTIVTVASLFIGALFRFLKWYFVRKDRLRKEERKAELAYEHDQQHPHGRGKGKSAP